MSDLPVVALVPPEHNPFSTPMTESGAALFSLVSLVGDAVRTFAPSEGDTVNLSSLSSSVAEGLAEQDEDEHGQMMKLSLKFC